MIYTDLNGNPTHLKGRKKVPDVQTFYMSERVFDKVPLHIHRPKGYVRYDERIINGKLVVYLDEPELIVMQPGSYNNNSNMSMFGHSGRYRFNIRFPDGKLYKANSSRNMKKVFKPYLQQCPEFVAQYKGKYRKKPAPFVEMIRLYNSLCDEK